MAKTTKASKTTKKATPAPKAQTEQEKLEQTFKALPRHLASALLAGLSLAKSKATNPKEIERQVMDGITTWDMEREVATKKVMGKIETLINEADFLRTVGKTHFGFKTRAKKS